MGLHTDHLASLRIQPSLSRADGDLLKGFSRTWHVTDRVPVVVVTPPADDDLAEDDVTSYDRVARLSALR